VRASRPRRQPWRLRRPGFLTPPRQGFSALAAFLLLMFIVGTAVADARRTVAPGSHETDFIAWLTVLGGVVGYVVARSALPLAGAHAVGAAVGTVAILVGLASAIVGADPLAWPDAGEVVRRMAALWDDLVLLTNPQTSGAGPRPWGFAMLVLGALCWTSAQFGAMSLFRHGRATPALGAAGILLFVDILVPSPYQGLDPVPVAVAFAGLSLFLLMRLHLAQQQAAWARRSVTEGTDVARVFVGAGAIFVAVVILATTTLTTFAVAEPGTIPWQSLARPLESVREQLLRVLEGLGVSIPPEPPEASLFSNRQEIPDRWDMGEGTAFRATVASGTMETPYWFGAAFDTLTRNGYEFTDARPTPIDSGMLAYGDLEIPPRSAPERELVTTTISPDRDGRYTLLGPATTTEVTASIRGRVLQRREGGARIGIELEPTTSAGFYDVTSLASDVPAGLTADFLRDRPTRYGPELDPFLRVPDNLIGPETERFIEQIDRRVAPNAIDRALFVQERLRDFEYETDMVGVCGDRPATECLLAEKKGFCSYYAVTMAAVLREMGVPARIVHGYLPGVQDGVGHWEVPLQAAHAWVEVWFEGVGWIRFDPTPELDLFGGAPTTLPEGGPDGEGPTPSAGPDEPTPSPDVAEPSPTPDPLADADRDRPPGGSDPDLATIALIIGAAVLGSLLVAGAFVLAFVRRLPGGDPALAYRGIVRLASRFGRGPTPAQTEYEYARSLSEALPSVSQELELVTRVHVEAVYGQRGAAGEAIVGLRRAYARVRTALLRLLLRR
jgi:transglutaminase-like putative cysteine protease